MADPRLPRGPQQPRAFDTTPTLLNQQLDYLKSTGVAVMPDAQRSRGHAPIGRSWPHQLTIRLTRRSQASRHPQRRAPVPHFSSPQTSPEAPTSAASITQPSQPAPRRQATQPWLSGSTRSAFVRLTRAIRLTLRRRRQAGRSPQHRRHRTQRSRRGRSNRQPQQAHRSRSLPHSPARRSSASSTAARTALAQVRRATAG